MHLISTFSAFFSTCGNYPTFGHMRRQPSSRQGAWAIISAPKSRQDLKGTNASVISPISFVDTRFASNRFVYMPSFSSRPIAPHHLGGSCQRICHTAFPSRTSWTPRPIISHGVSHNSVDSSGQPTPRFPERKIQGLRNK